MNSEDMLRAAIEKGNYEHSILIWGATKKSINVINKFNEWGFSVCGYIDRRAEQIEKFHGLNVHSVDILADHKYFVYVSVEAHYDDIFSEFEKLGYLEFEDFWYPNKKICLDGTHNYNDAYGNELNTKLKVPIKVYLRDGGRVTLGNSKIDGSVKIAAQRNAMVSIGDKCVVEKDSVISATDGCICMKNHCILSHNGLLRASLGGSLEIHENCTMQFLFVAVASMGAKVVIGRDMMASYHVLIRAGNSHNIIDLETGTHLDKNVKRDIYIGDHVWLGMRCTLLNGAKIGSGSAVGANAFVNKSFPNNSCIAGNPARIVRKKVAWLRDGREFHTDIDDYEEFIY